MVFRAYLAPVLATHVPTPLFVTAVFPDTIRVQDPVSRVLATAFLVQIQLPVSRAI
jgi:hypothetical protein